MYKKETSPEHGKKNKVTVLAPRKVNLSLEVTGLDENGYHNLDMIMQSVSVYEKVTLTKTDSGITISSNARYIPTDSKNVAVKAAIKFFEFAGIQKGGVHIFVKKTVPIKAGMAGGSADAAAVLVGLNKLYKTNFGITKLCRLAAQVGSDVPFMIVGGTRRVGGVGDIISYAPPMPECWFVICMPERGVSTPVAFANYDKLGKKADIQTEKLVQALKDKDIYAVARYLGNDLEEAAASPDTRPIKEALIKHGALGSVMTGSGRAVFGIFDSREKAKSAYEYFRGKVRSAFIAKPVPMGAKILPSKERKSY